MTTNPVCAWCQKAYAAGHYDGHPICANCYSLAMPCELPVLPDLVIERPFYYCRRCNSKISLTTVVCPNCRFAELSLAPDEFEVDPMPQAVEIPIANLCWRCEHCRYEYNVQEACTQCGQPRVTPGENEGPRVDVRPAREMRPVEEEKIPQAVRASPEIHPQVDQKTQRPNFVPHGSLYESDGIELWSCSKGHLYNLQGKDNACRVCDEFFPNYLAPPMSSLLDESSVQWTCINCQALNRLKTHCVRCNSPRDFISYLRWQNVPLVDNEKKWQCSLCKCWTDVTNEKCATCKQNVQKAIAKWKRTEIEENRGWTWACCCCD